MLEEFIRQVVVTLTHTIRVTTSPSDRTQLPHMSRKLLSCPYNDNYKCPCKRKKNCMILMI